MPSIVAVLRTGTGRENWASERSVPDQAQPCKSRGGAGILGLSLICDLQSHCCRCRMEETRRLQLTLLQLWDTGDTLQTHILSFPVPAVPSTSGAHTFLKRFKKNQPKFQKENKRWSSWITLKISVLQGPFTRGYLLCLCGLTCVQPSEFLPRSGLGSCVEHPLRMPCHLLCL